MKKVILSATALVLLGTVGFLSMPVNSMAKSSFVKNMMINWRKLWAGIKALGDAIIEIIDAIAEGKAVSTGSGQTQVQVDVAQAMGNPELRQQGIDVTNDAITFTRDVVVTKGPLNTLLFSKGSYKLDENGVATVRYEVIDNQ